MNDEQDLTAGGRIVSRTSCCGNRFPCGKFRRCGELPERIPGTVGARKDSRTSRLPIGQVPCGVYPQLTINNWQLAIFHSQPRGLRGPAVAGRLGRRVRLRAYPLVLHAHARLLGLASVAVRYPVAPADRHEVKETESRDERTDAD
jgi:hypothetical protein